MLLYGISAEEAALWAFIWLKMRNNNSCQIVMAETLNAARVHIGSDVFLFLYMQFVSVNTCIYQILTSSQVHQLLHS